MRPSSLAAALSAAIFLTGLTGCGESKKEAASAPKAPAADRQTKKADEPKTPPAAQPAAIAPATAQPAAAPAAVALPKAAESSKPGKPLDVSFVGPGFYAAVVLHPRRLLQSPLIAPLLKDPDIAAAIQQWEIDPANIEQILMLTPIPSQAKAASSPDSPSFIVRFAQPVDAKKLLVKFQSMMGQGAPDQLAETTCEGKRCYQFATAPWILTYVPNERTVVIANDKDMKAMLSAGEPKGPLVDRLRQADADNDLIVAVALDPIRDLVKAGVEQAKRAPSPVAAFADVPMLLNGSTLAVNLSGDTLLKVVLNGNDAPGADRVEALVKQGLDMLKAQLAAAQKDMPEPVKAPIAPALTLAEQSLGGVGMTKTLSQLVVTSRRPASMDDAFPKLVAMVKTSMMAARQAARRVQEMNNLRQIAMAMLIYEQSRGMLPPAVLRDSEGRAMWSWRVALLPYVGEKALFDQLHRNEPWDSPHNLLVAKQTPRVFQSADRPNDGKTSVMVFTGAGTAFAEDKRFAIADAKDGPANTLLLVEAGADKAVLWTKPEDLRFDPQNPLLALGQIAPEGFLAAYFDGHVERLKVDAQRLRALITPSGGEPVDAK